MAIKNVKTAAELVEMARTEFDLLWNEGDLDAASEYYLDSHVAHNPDGDYDVEGFRAFVEGYRTAFPDLEMTVEDCFASDDRVCLRWSATGTHDGPLGDVEATGESVEVTGIVVHHIQDGKYAESWGEFDALGMLQQLGIVPEMGS